MVPRLDRIALAPIRIAERSSQRVLADETRRLVDRVFAGDLPETVAHAVEEHRVIERVTPSLEETVTIVLRSDAVRQAVYDVVAGAELHRAITAQAAGFGSELAAALRRAAERADAATDVRIRPTLARAPATAGIWTRASAFVVDLALAQTVFLLGAATVALVAAFATPLRQSAVDASLAGAGWLLVETVYFTGFWSLVGRTPGMRLLGIRLADDITIARALVRLAALVVATVPFCLGLLPVVLDRRRRGLHDMVARTAVVRT